MVKNIKFKYKLPIYGCYINILFEQDAINKYFENEEDRIDDLCDGLCGFFNEGHFFIYIDNRLELKDFINTMAHEISHLIDKISDFHNLERHRYSSNEHMAYLQGYLSEIIFEKFEEFKKMSNNKK